MNLYNNNCNNIPKSDSLLVDKFSHNRLLIFLYLHAFVIVNILVCEVQKFSKIRLGCSHSHFYTKHKEIYSKGIEGHMFITVDLKKVNEI